MENLSTSSDLLCTSQTLELLPSVGSLLDPRKIVTSIISSISILVLVLIFWSRDSGLYFLKRTMWICLVSDPNSGVSWLRGIKEVEMEILENA